MFTQREMDLALVEGKAEVQKLLQEWVVDYLGSRLDGIDTGGNEAAGAAPQVAQGANITGETGPAPY